MPQPVVCALYKSNAGAFESVKRHLLPDPCATDQPPVKRDWLGFSGAESFGVGAKGRTLTGADGVTAAILASGDITSKTGVKPPAAGAVTPPTKGADNPAGEDIFGTSDGKGDGAETALTLGTATCAEGEKRGAGGGKGCDVTGGVGVALMAKGAFEAPRGAELERGSSDSPNLLTDSHPCKKGKLAKTTATTMFRNINPLYS